MWRSFYEHAELLELPLLSMFLFLVTFAGASFFGWRIKADDPRASLPLADDDGRADGVMEMGGAS
ncbi:MAG TPA: hypothetical protein VGF99_06995 [Myxococcota bacterium]